MWTMTLNPLLEHVEAVPGGMSRRARALSCASELALRAGRLWHHQAVGTRESEVDLTSSFNETPSAVCHRTYGVLCSEKDFFAHLKHMYNN